MGPGAVVPAVIIVPPPPRPPQLQRQQPVQKRQKCHSVATFATSTQDVRLPAAAGVPGAACGAALSTAHERSLVELPAGYFRCSAPVRRWREYKCRSNRTQCRVVNEDDNERRLMWLGLLGVRLKPRGPVGACVARAPKWAFPCLKVVRDAQGHEILQETMGQGVARAREDQH
ncbi:unnamed protein product, partial [Cladocopium goreaui]